MLTPRHVVIGTILAAAALGSSPARAEDSAEVRAVRTAGLVVTDGKGHYVAFAVADPATPLTSDDDVLFYGDGKTFYRQTIKGSGSNTFSEGQRLWQILDERIGLDLQKSMLEIEKGEYLMHCVERTTPLRVLDAKEARKLVAKAVFKGPRMDRVAFLVGRDGTTYYVVDAQRGEDGKDWKVFVGKRGALKPLKIKDVSADSAGVVFTSSTGTLKGDKRSGAMTWEPKPGKQISLSAIPVDRNLTLVYRELGVYNTPFGVPCDDL